MGKYQIDEGQFGRVFAPKLEHGVLPPDEAAEHEHHGNLERNRES